MICALLLEGEGGSSIGESDSLDQFQHATMNTSEANVQNNVKIIIQNKARGYRVDAVYVQDPSRYPVHQCSTFNVNDQD